MSPAGEPRTPECRFCARAAAHDASSTSGMSPLCETLHRGRAAERDGAVLSAARVRLRPVLPGAAARSTSRPSDIFTRVRLLLVVLDSWVEHARRYAERCIERFGLGAEQPGRRDRQQRRLPAAALRRARHPGARHRAGRQRRRGRASSKGVPTAVRFFGRETARELAARARQADLLLGNNVLAHVPDLNDFVAGMKILLEADGVHHDGVPAPERLMDGEPVRHDLPRALLLLLVLTRRADLRRTTA